MKSSSMLYSALLDLKVPAERALAVVQAFESDLFEKLVTKESHELSVQLLLERIDARMKTLETSIKTSSDSLNASLQNSVTALMTRDENLNLRSTVKLGAMLATVAAISLTIAKFLFG
jgi:hypothetical protein